jgi:hypothetical protein
MTIVRSGWIDVATGPNGAVVYIDHDRPELVGSVEKKVSEPRAATIFGIDELVVVGDGP